jgi:hypothetical protein
VEALRSNVPMVTPRLQLRPSAHGWLVGWLFGEIYTAREIWMHSNIKASQAWHNLRALSKQPIALGSMLGTGRDTQNTGSSPPRMPQRAKEHLPGFAQLTIPRLQEHILSCLNCHSSTFFFFLVR